MSPDQKAGRLNTIADEIDAARRLVEAGGMACEGLDPHERDPLSELLGAIGERLAKVAADAREAGHEHQ